MAPQDNSHLSKMDPEFAENLERMSSPPPALDGDIPTMRAMLAGRKRKMVEALLKDTKGVVKNDLTVPARDGSQIPIRTYLPENTAGSLPLIIFMHGGGFCLGGLENEEVLCHQFVQSNGAAVVNVDYRLAPENIFPAAANDAWDVTKWVASNASSLGADLSKGFIVGGVSAGANLAAVVAHLARDEKLSPPLTGSLLQVPVLMAPATIEDKYKPDIKSYDENANAPVLNQKSIEKLMSTYKPDPNSHLFNLFAPPVKFDGLPPTFIQIAGMDPLRDEGLLYERLLREEHGVRTNLEVYPGLPHGFWSFFPEMKSSKKLIEDTIKGLGWLLEVGK